MIHDGVTLLAGVPQETASSCVNPVEDLAGVRREKKKEGSVAASRSAFGRGRSGHADLRISAVLASPTSDLETSQGRRHVNKSPAPNSGQATQR